MKLGGGGVWCAVSFSTECERPRSLSDCMHELYTQNVLEISLTDQSRVGGLSPSSYPSHLQEAVGFFFFGGGESGTCDSCCHLHRRCVSQRRVLSVLWVFFEVTQRRRDSVDGLICCLSVLHPGSLGCLCSCRRVIASVFLRSSVDSGAHPLALSPSLCGAAAEGSWTIEAGGCAWQSYWGAQPECRWHSPLRSLPRSPAC